MYIAQMLINGFRNFASQTINFNDGVNVIIGHNNAGKTNLIKAIALVIDTKISKKLSIDDFNKDVVLLDLKKNAPRVSISLILKQNEDDVENKDDLALVGSWLTKLEEPYEAKLTYEFFLPQSELSRYLEEIGTAETIDQAWIIIKHEFLRLYVSRIYGGEVILQNVAENEFLQKFDFQFLNAIRDVERDMFTGRNTLLKEVLDFFIDYEIKSAPESAKSNVQKSREIKERKIEFSDQSQKLMDKLQERMKSGKLQILSYASETGASFNNATPNFEGNISEIELYSALRLIVEYETGIKIPATHNGLGYNNLIYMSLLLAKMQVDSDGNYLGNNAKVFPILAIEEPEAHLHPAMQYKFLKFLKENKETKKKVRQIFVTTHSTHITSAVSLDEIICLHTQKSAQSSSYQTHVAYPGKVFEDNEEGKESKAYVKRFLDATRSDMLFAQKVILVEGLAEQLLLSTLAKYHGKSIEDNHIAIINVGGRYFDHFLKLFDSQKPNTIQKKVLCLIDRDPTRKSKTPQGAKFKKCYPFQFNTDSSNFDYQDNASSYLDNYKGHPNIYFSSQSNSRGKTFEYALAYSNPNCKLIITDSISNKKELESLIALYSESKPLDNLLDVIRSSDENNEIVSSLTSSISGWDDDEKKKALISARYLNSVGKGSNALELSYKLEANLVSPKPERFVVPDYIVDGLNWICT